MSSGSRRAWLWASSREDIRALAAIGGVLGMLWSLGLLVLRIPVLTPLGDQAALSPLYVFLKPSLRWTALAFPLLCIILLSRLPRSLRVESTSRRAFSFQLVVASLSLPLSLLAVRQPLSELGSLLGFYPGEEIYYDALRIRDLGHFYRHYTDLIPQLSLHGQHFPPGLATLHYFVGLLFGGSFAAAGVAILILFALGMLCAYRALCTRLGEERGRQAILLCLACPSLLDFACTSTDAVFFAAASLSLWLSLRALDSPKNPARSVLAGSAVFLAVLLSYSALPMGLAILLLGLLRCREGGRAPLLALGAMGASFSVLAALLWLATGFSLPQHFLAAHAHNLKLMTQVIGSDPTQHFLLIAYGNAAAFAIGLGIAVAAALFLRLRQGALFVEPFRIAICCSLALMVLGNLYQMETERIWMYAVPWMAALALDGEALRTRSLVRLLIAGWLQAYVMEIFLFTLW